MADTNDQKKGIVPVELPEDTISKKAADAVEKRNRKERAKKERMEENGPKKKNRKARLLVSGIALLLVVIIVVVVLNIRPAGAGITIDKAFQPPSYLNSKFTSILICGIDDEEGRDVKMTDVIMVANFDRERNQAALLQIPRDTYVGENLVYTGKINALYNWGYKDNSRDPGVNCLVETIYRQLKLQISNYVMITMEGFRKAVDAMGGIEVTIDTTIDFENGTVLEPGTHLLDGTAADWFVRFRGYATADIERMNMQRYFMAALLHKLTSMSTIDMASILNTIYAYLETDLTISEIISLASEVKQLSTDAITMVRLPGEPVAKYGYYGLDVWTLHKKETAEMLNKYMRPYGDPVPETELELIELQKTITDYDDPGSNIGEY